MKAEKKALENYHTFLKIVSRDEINRDKAFYLNTLYCNRGLAEVHLSAHQIDSAKYYLDEAMLLFPHVSESRQLLPFGTLGNIYFKQELYGESLEAFQKVKELSFKIYQSFDKHKVKSRSIKDIGHVYFAQKHFDAALKHYQQALLFLALDFDNDSIATNPKLSQLISKKEGLEIIQAKAKSFFQKWKSNQNPENLELAFKNSQMAIEIINAIRKDLTEEGSKLILAQKSMEVYESGIETAYELYKLTKDEQYLVHAFQIIEQNKGAVLLESLKGKEALAQSQIPLIEAEKEEDLCRDINFYTSKINRAKSRPEKVNKEKVKSWENKVFTLKQTQP